MIDTKFDVTEEIKNFVNQLPDHDANMRFICECCEKPLTDGQCLVSPCIPRIIQAKNHCCNRSCHPERYS